MRGHDENERKYRIERERERKYTRSKIVVTFSLQTVTILRRKNRGEKFLTGNRWLFSYPGLVNKDIMSGERKKRTQKRHDIFDRRRGE
jgi:hypothetical protein